MKPKYYDSVDTCPIMLFLSISQGKKDISALCFEGKSRESDAQAAWDRLYDEFVQEFGVSTEYIHYTRERAILCEWLKALHVDGEKWRKPMIKVKEAEIRQLEASMQGGDTDFNVLLGKLSRKMGFGIDPMRTTVRQFYSYIKSL